MLDIVRDLPEASDGLLFGNTESSADRDRNVPDNAI
jgi:hypothetical protein